MGGVRIQSYIASKVALNTGLALGMIILSIFLVDIVEQARTVGERTQLSLFGAAQLSTLKLPLLIQQTLPFATLIGAMMAYRGLARRSELPAMRASGLSTWRMLAPAGFLAVVLGIFGIFVLDPLSVSANKNFEALRERLIAAGQARPVTLSEQIWMRQGDATGQVVIHAKARGAEPGTLAQVEFFIFDRVYTDGIGNAPDYAFVKRVDAQTAVLREGRWDLTDVVEHVPGGDPIESPASVLISNLEPDALLRKTIAPNRVSFFELPRVIQQSLGAGLNATRYELKLQQLLAQPILLAAMALIGAMFCLKLDRLGGTGRLVAYGALAGFLLFFFNRLAEGFALTGAVPPMLAAWCPPLAALFASLAVLAYQEDG
jgi:lipopolysaccharide export system permease protein